MSTYLVAFPEAGRFIFTLSQAILDRLEEIPGTDGKWLRTRNGYITISDSGRLYFKNMPGCDGLLFKSYVGHIVPVAKDFFVDSAAVEYDAIKGHTNGRTEVCDMQVAEWCSLRHHDMSYKQDVEVWRRIHGYKPRKVKEKTA